MAIPHKLQLLKAEYLQSTDEGSRVKLLYEIGEQWNAFHDALAFLVDLVEGLHGAMSLPERRALAGSLPLFLVPFPRKTLAAIERFAKRTSNLDVFAKLHEGLKSYRIHPQFRKTSQYTRTVQTLLKKALECRGVVFETWDSVCWEIRELDQLAPSPPLLKASRNGKKGE